MNENFKQKDNRNQYEGNGWSKYQIMVLQQLDDHNKLMLNFNKELVDAKQNIAVSEVERKMWQNQISSKVEQMEKDLDNILYGDEGLKKRVEEIERGIDIEGQIKTRLRATWALYAAGAMFLLNIGIQIVELILKHFIAK